MMCFIRHQSFSKSTKAILSLDEYNFGHVRGAFDKCFVFIGKYLPPWTLQGLASAEFPGCDTMAKVSKKQYLLLIELEYQKNLW